MADRRCAGGRHGEEEDGGQRMQMGHETHCRTSWALVTFVGLDRLNGPHKKMQTLGFGQSTEEVRTAGVEIEICKAAELISSTWQHQILLIPDYTANNGPLLLQPP